MAREKAPLPNAAPADDKKRAIDTAMAQIERMYGKGAIMRFGDKAELNVDYIPTGSLSLLARRCKDSVISVLLSIE